MRVPRPPLRSRAHLAVCCAILVAACEDQLSTPQPLNPGDIRGFVSADLAAQLTPDGRFPLAEAAPEPYPQISREQAAELAIAWARTYGKFIRPYLERDHGQRIDFDALRVISPVWYAAAVYDPAPSNAHPGYRNAFGPHYLMYLGVGEEPVLGVSVAAFAQATVTDGRLVLPASSGNEVIAYGVPPGWGFSLPVSPEQAARIAATAGQARATAVPELINPHRDYHPYHARWKVTLDRPVNARLRSGEMRATREVYVGAHGELQVPAAVQQEPGASFELEDGGRFSLQRRTDRPVLFEPVHLGSR